MNRKKTQLIADTTLSFTTLKNALRYLQFIAPATQRTNIRVAYESSDKSVGLYTESRRYNGRFAYTTIYSRGYENNNWIYDSTWILWNGDNPTSSNTQSLEEVISQL